MSYIKQTFTDFDTVLNANIMNHIEDGIYHSQEVPNEILGNSFICSYGGIKSSGYVKNTSGIYGCTTWLHCADSENITVRMMIETSNSGYGLAFYDSEKTLLKFIANNIGTTMSSEIRNLNVPKGAVYFRTTYYSYSNLGSQEDFYASIPHSSDYFANGKKAYQEGQINYSVFVNQTCPDVTSETQTNQDAEEIKSSMCVLCLPKTYSPIGKPTPSIILCMGANGYITYEDFRGNPDTWIQFIELLNEAGYAVIGCQGGYDNAGSYVKPSGAPQAIHAHHKAFTWAKQHYNLAEKTNYCGCSMGGLIAMNAPLLYNNEIQTVSMMAGMIDSYAQGWARQGSDAKSVMTKYYGFSSSSTYETDKVGNYNPMSRIKTINDVDYVFNAFPPTKMWHGNQDTTLHEYASNQKYVTAMKNSGLIADMRMIDGCDHGLARGVYTYDGVTYTNAVEELIAFLNRYNK